VLLGTARAKQGHGLQANGHQVGQTRSIRRWNTRPEGNLLVALAPAARWIQALEGLVDGAEHGALPVVAAALAAAVGATVAHGPRLGILAAARASSTIF